MQLLSPIAYHFLIIVKQSKQTHGLHVLIKWWNDNYVIISLTCEVQKNITNFKLKADYH